MHFLNDDIISPIAHKETIKLYNENMKNAMSSPYKEFETLKDSKVGDKLMSDRGANTVRMAPQATINSPRSHKAVTLDLHHLIDVISSSL